MNIVLPQLSIAVLLLFHGDAAWPQEKPDSTYQFSRRKYRIEMRVRFPAPYEGRRLTVHQGTDPGKEVCLSLNADAGGCTESFVGALAVVTFLVRQATGTKSAAQSIRERVTLLDQSPGLPDRLPFEMSIKLVNDTGSDVQVFGYDESPLPQIERTAEREAGRTAWRRFRQELYLDKDRDPFAVIEWLHTIRGIDILRVDGPFTVGEGRSVRLRYTR